MGGEIEDFIEKTYVKKQEAVKSTIAVLGVAGIIAGLFFLSPNLTGNVIGNLTNSTSNYTGIILIALGVLGVYFYKKK